MMERIAEHLDYLTVYGSQIFQNSTIVQKVLRPILSLITSIADQMKTLVQAFIDLIDFFLAVQNVFGNLDSRMCSLFQQEGLG